MRQTPLAARRGRPMCRPGRTRGVRPYNGGCKMHAMKNRHALAFLFAAATPLPLAAAREASLTLDDIQRMADVRDPQCSPDGRSIALRGVAHRREGRQAGSSHIWTVGVDGKNDRQVTSSHRQRVVAEMESRRQISVVHVVAPRQGQGQPGVAARSQRRRGVSADRGQGTAAGLRVVARLEAARAGRRRSGSDAAVDAPPDPAASARRRSRS